MILNRYENNIISKAELPLQWQTVEAQKELYDFLQLNWEQRASLYYDPEEAKTKQQQYLSFTVNQDLRTRKYIGTIVFKGEQLNIYPRVFSKGKTDQNTEGLTSEINQNDLYQILEYARKHGVSDVFLLYPMYRFEKQEPLFPVAISESPSGSINVHPIRLPFVFEEDDDSIKNELRSVLLSIMGIEAER